MIESGLWPDFFVPAGNRVMRSLSYKSQFPICVTTLSRFGTLLSLLSFTFAPAVKPFSLINDFYQPEK